MLRANAAPLWVLLVITCGPSADPGEAKPGADTHAPAAEETNDLLARAARNMKNGALAPADRDAIVASEAAAHARARRVLLALEAPLGDGDGDAVEEPADADGADPALVIPPAEEAAPIPAADDSKSQSSPAAPRARPSAAPAKPPAPTGSRPLVTGFGFSAGKGGDLTFTVRASSGVSIGLANQRRSGIVRLVVDSAGALPAVLGARPASRGAAVTAVTKGTQSVFITLTLDPGWSVVSLRRTPRGARVTLRPTA